MQFLSGTAQRVYIQDGLDRVGEQYDKRITIRGERINTLRTGRITVVVGNVAGIIRERILLAELIRLM